jgi:hypothetical protein
LFPAEALLEASAAMVHNSGDVPEAGAANDGELEDLTGADAELIANISSSFVVA